MVKRKKRLSIDLDCHGTHEKISTSRIILKKIKKMSVKTQIKSVLIFDTMSRSF